jgi:hypothetical protein
MGPMKHGIAVQLQLVPKRQQRILLLHPARDMQPDV